jgi:putative nucleotidyltransferase with HDIG domain
MMEVYIFSGIIILLALGLVVYIASTQHRTKTQKPVLKKAPARYIAVAPEEDVQAFMEVYNLEWKPPQNLEPEIPPEIDKIINSIDNISPLVTDLSSKLSDPDINPKDISKLIITDQGLTSFILKRVNSPFYGLAQKVENIFNAIVLLGYNEIYRIVMEERTRKIGIKPDKTEWVHANLTSTIAAYVASTSRLNVPSGIMVTLGMLHDIAKTIMQQSLPKPEKEFSNDPRKRLKQEIEYYGIDHATLGGVLAKRWNMPQRIVQCIEKHHWPMFWPLREIGQSNPEIIKEIAILCISDIAARNFTKEITGSYIGDDYYRYVKKSPKVESILTPEITKDLKRIRRILLEDVDNDLEFQDIQEQQQ